MAKRVSMEEGTDDDDEDLGFPDEELESVSKSDPSSGRPSLDESVRNRSSNASRASSARQSIDEERPEELERGKRESGAAFMPGMWEVLNEGKGEDPVGKGFAALKDYLSQTYEDVVGSIVENIQVRGRAVKSERDLFEPCSK